MPPLATPTLRRYAEKRSILDDVLAEAQRLENQLGQSDRQRLNEYLNSVRETEQRVERLVDWVDVPKPEVNSQYLQLGSQPGDAHDRPMWIDVMLELSYLTFATDMTRVITYEWSREAGGYGGGGENHHELSHHGGDAGHARIARPYRSLPPRTARSIHDVPQVDSRGRRKQCSTTR